MYTNMPMETTVIQMRAQSELFPFVFNNVSFAKPKQKQSSISYSNNIASLKPEILENSSLLTGSENYLVDNLTNFDRYQILSNDTSGQDSSLWIQCKEWTPAQHTLFQTAHFFFAAAFLIPGSFKQSVLIVRALLTIGYVFLMAWGSVDICAPDILAWNSILVLLNLIHTLVLTWKFLPPTLTLELMELYIKVFKPLHVSKKQFKELVKEGKVMSLDRGDIYAVEDISPADERLSILLEGKLRVTCDDTHLHFINVHHFIDSPEWEANHEQSDNVFQVTIVAEEDSIYFCWPRMKLERILRHKPRLKIIFDSIIGKDITQKLYALNEHLSGISEERNRERRNEIWNRSCIRSLSMDAVNTGTTGLVRSQAYLCDQTKNSPQTVASSCLGTTRHQMWVPLVAKQFPAKSPFTNTNQVSASLPYPEVYNDTPRKKNDINV